jgi:signal transduction histidine kinase
VRIALKKYVEEWSSHTGADVTLQVEGDQILPAQTERVVFRFVQEALSNVARHAETQNAAVRLEFSPDLLTIEVEDKGVGFSVDAVESTGFGITNMRARIKQLGGEMTIASRMGQGTCLSAQIPIID